MRRQESIADVLGMQIERDGDLGDISMNQILRNFCLL